MPKIFRFRNFIFSKSLNNDKGFTLVEIIVVIMIIVSAFMAILAFFSFDARVSERGRMRLEAISLAEGEIEAVRHFRDNSDWSFDGIGTMVPGNNYHSVKSSLSWDIVPGSETINGFTLAVVFSNVSRDGNGNIEQIYNAPNNDSDTKKVVVTVNWSDRNGAVSENLQTYLTNWRRN